MKIGGMGGLEIVIILVVVLIIFGPKNLPKLGKAFGKTVSNLRAGMNEGKKKESEEAAEVVRAEASDDSAAEPQPALFEATAESAEPSEPAPAASEPEGELIETAEHVAAQAEAAADEAFQPKKVKRVVKKKVN